MLNLPIPHRVKPGEPVRAADYNRLIELVSALQRVINSHTPCPSVDVKPRISRGGTTYHTTPRPGASTANIRPLTIRRGTAVDKFQIVPGYVNSVMPTLVGTALNNATAPEFTVAADTYAWIKCVGTFGTPDTYVATIETSATAAVPAGTDISATGFVSYFYIGKVIYATGTPDTYTITNQHGGGNLGVDSWGLYNLWWRA